MIRTEERDLDTRALRTLEAERLELWKQRARFRRFVVGFGLLAPVVGIPLALGGGAPRAGIGSGLRGPHVTVLHSL